MADDDDYDTDDTTNFPVDVHQESMSYHQRVARAVRNLRRANPLRSGNFHWHNTVFQQGVPGPGHEPEEAVPMSVSDITNEFHRYESTRPYALGDATPGFSRQPPPPRFNPAGLRPGFRPFPDEIGRLGNVHEFDPVTASMTELEEYAGGGKVEEPFEAPQGEEGGEENDEYEQHELDQDTEERNKERSDTQEAERRSRRERVAQGRRNYRSQPKSMHVKNVR